MSQIGFNVAVLRHGDSQGNRMVLRLETCGGTVVHAIGVPQDRPSRTGPTWAYLFNADGLTLIDPGAHGSFDELASGIAVAGFAVKDVDRLVLSHGHYDHDGSTAQVISESGASLWAHQVYASLLPYAPWNVQQQDSSPLHAEVARLIRQSTRENSGHDSPLQNDNYLVNRRELHV
ncbi:MBL fold metallo-hydrolase, partial [Dehalococcoidia bacterium]|nr:MBL fold metallo-hydrolase [Dehalococcoidia bacterium]